MTQQHPATGKRGAPSYARKAASAAVLTTALLAGLSTAPGTAPQALAAQGISDPEVVTLHTGQEFKLPYKKMPTNTSFAGFPGLDGNDWEVGWKKAQAAFNDGKPDDEDPDDFALNRLRMRLQDDLPDAAPRSISENIHRYENFDEARELDTAVNMGRGTGDKGSGVAYLCSNPDVSCGFVGTVTERAPIIGQSDNIQGPTEFTTTMSSTNTHTRVKEEGWSVGGSLNFGYGQDTKSGEVTSKPSAGGSMNFTYSNKTTDTQQYSQTQSRTLKRTVPEGYWGYEEVRAAAAKYTGFFVINLTHPRFKQFENLHGLHVIPMTTTVKAEGNVPPVTRFLVKTVDQNTPMMTEARKVQKDITETHRQLGDSSGPQRKKLETSLEELTSRKDKLLRDSSAEVEVSKPEFG